jgi:hypothetical protein
MKGSSEEKEKKTTMTTDGDFMEWETRSDTMPF